VDRARGGGEREKEPALSEKRGGEKNFLKRRVKCFLWQRGGDKRIAAWERGAPPPAKKPKKGGGKSRDLSWVAGRKEDRRCSRGAGGSHCMKKTKIRAVRTLQRHMRRKANAHLVTRGPPWNVKGDVPTKKGKDDALQKKGVLPFTGIRGKSLQRGQGGPRDGGGGRPSGTEKKRGGIWAAKTMTQRGEKDNPY